MTAEFVEGGINCTDWIGDGYCDNGVASKMDLMCEYYGNDGGDCGDLGSIKEKRVLEQLYMMTGGDTWLNNKQWNEGDHCTGSWVGVFCEGGKVTKIEFVLDGWNNMTGSLPSFADLDALTYLNLGNNFLQGSIPALPDSLEGLYLDRNYLTNELPPLPSSLKQIWVNSNLLSGSIPALPEALERIYLESNQLSGELPPLNHLANLAHFQVHYNQLSGPVPSLANLNKLEIFSAYSNSLTSLPEDIGSATSLTYLNLQDNKLASIPDSIGDLTNLQTLDLADNDMRAPFPQWIENLVNLQLLYLFDNRLFGSLPPLPSTLKEIDLSINELTGPLPPLSALTNLEELAIYNNQISSTLPQDFSVFPNLKNLLAHDNDLSGDLSPTLFALPNLEIVILSGNPKLSGTPFPSELSSPSLHSIVIEGCNLSGGLPSTIGAPKLESLYLAGNRLSSPIPRLPASIKKVSLANNQLRGFLSGNFFTGLDNLESFDIKNNQVSGTIPYSLESLESLQELKLDLNHLSGPLPTSMSDWPVYKSPTSTTSVLFGNFWSCPVDDAIRDHLGDDPSHAYVCGDSTFATPLVLFSAAASLFCVALFFSKNKGSLRRPASTTEEVSNGAALLFATLRSLKFVVVAGLTSVALFVTFWFASSPFVDQPPLLRLSLAMKSAGDDLLVPLVCISSLTLFYFVRWGWALRFEGGATSAATNEKPLTLVNVIKALAVFLYTMALLTVFDFVFIFFIASNNKVSTATKAFAATALAQIKSTLLSERWSARQGAKLLRPKKLFNFLVATMSSIMLLNAVLVPSVLILLLDDRCFRSYPFPGLGALAKEAPHEVDIDYTFCTLVKPTDGSYGCPNAGNQNDGYATATYQTTFEYPWSLSDQCSSAVIELYSPVVMASLVISDVLQPACWWLLRENGGQVTKWLVLLLGLAVTFMLPLVGDAYGSAISETGGWGLVLFMIVVFLFCAGLGSLTVLMAGKGGKRGKGSEYLPSVEYLLEFFGYSFDEDNLLGSKGRERWALFEDAPKRVVKTMMTMQSKGAGNDGYDSEASYDSYSSDSEEEGQKEKVEEKVKVKATERKSRTKTMKKKASSKELKTSELSHQKYGRDLCSTYADLIKTLGTILTYGLANPLVGLIGAAGLAVRACVLAYLIGEWDKKVSAGERVNVVSDAQGVPFRCILLVVGLTLVFFCIVGNASGVDDGPASTAVMWVAVVLMGAEVAWLAWGMDVSECMGWQREEGEEEEGEGEGRVVRLSEIEMGDGERKVRFANMESSGSSPAVGFDAAYHSSETADLASTVPSSNPMAGLDRQLSSFQASLRQDSAVV